MGRSRVRRAPAREDHRSDRDRANPGAQQPGSDATRLRAAGRSDFAVAHDELVLAGAARFANGREATGFAILPIRLDDHQVILRDRS